MKTNIKQTTFFLVILFLIPLVQAQSLAISSLPFQIKGSTVLSDGTLFAVKGYSLLKSTNLGTTWITVSWLPFSVDKTFYATSKNGLLTVSGGKYSYGKIWLSTNRGVSWLKVYGLGLNETVWNFQEYKGKVYASIYSYESPPLKVHARILISNDFGLTWKVLTTFVGYRHVHEVFVNAYNGWIYAAVGDATPALMRSKDGGITWTNLHSKMLFTSINARGSMVYLGEDVYVYDKTDSTRIWRFNDTGNGIAVLEKVFDYGSRYAGNVFWIKELHGKLVFGTVPALKGWTALIGVSNGDWSAFSIVRQETVSVGWTGFQNPTSSYWPLPLILVKGLATSNVVISV